VLLLIKNGDRWGVSCGKESILGLKVSDRHLNLISKIVLD
jgi:hypothetical protein